MTLDLGPSRTRRGSCAGGVDLQAEAGSPGRMPRSHNQRRAFMGGRFLLSAVVLASGIIRGSRTRSAGRR